MRDYVGIDYSSLPAATEPDFQPRVRRMLGDIDYFLRDLSRGQARIQQGEVPDGSGNQIGNNGTLTDYWFKPGISDTFIAYMGKAAGQGGLISSTSDQDKGFLNFGNTLYIDEDGKLSGFNVTAPAAAVHIQPGVSGTTTLIANTILVNNWDNRKRTGTGGADDGAIDVVAYQTNNGYTSYSGVGGGIGANTNQFSMSGTITPGKTWTVTLQIAMLSGSTASKTGDMEFHIIDSSGNKFTKTGLTGIYTGLAFDGAFHPITFTLDCSTGSTGTGTANSVIIGLTATELPSTDRYTALTYFEISTGGDSDIARWNNSSATLLGKINSAGLLGVGTGSTTLTSMLTVVPAAAATVGITVQGAASQSGNLTEWRNSASALLSRIKSDGTFEGPISTTSAVAVTDSTFSILDNSDPTKIAQFQCATIGTGTTKTFTFPNFTGTLSLIDNNETISGTRNHTGQITYNHQTTALPLLINTVPGDGTPASDAASFMRMVDTVSNFKMDLQVTSGAGLTSDKVVFFPDGNGEVVLALATQTISNKSLSSTNNKLICNTGSTGVAFVDSANNSKAMRFIMSGASANNHTITVVNTAARTYTLPNDTGTVNMIVAPSAAATDLTGKTGAVTAATIYTTTHAGFFQMEAYTVITAFTGAGTITVDATWTDPAATNTNVTFSTFAYTAVNQNSFVTGTGPHRVSFYATSGSAIQVRTTFSGTATYSTYVRLTALT